MTKPIELKLNIFIAHTLAYALVKFRLLALSGLREKTKKVIWKRIFARYFESADSLKLIFTEIICVLVFLSQELISNRFG